MIISKQEKMKKHIFFSTIAILIMQSSCIPLKQYQELQEREKENSSELRRLEEDYRNAEVDNDELKADIKRFKEKVAKLVNDTLRLSKQNWNLKNRNKELLTQYNEFLSGYGVDKSSAGSKELLQHLQSLHEELQKREDALFKSERELVLKKQRLETASLDLKSMEGELEERNRRLIELEKALTEKDSLMNALKNTVASALTDFGSDELEVHIKNGKVYVSMEEKLLFKSGSYQVSDIGINALKRIAGVLEQKKDINVLVEGHTDDVPYKSTVLLDNWDLSVKRATSVTRILLQNANVEPYRITASGRGEFVPIESSKTPEARRKNRRTEIILSPNLDQVFDLLESN